MLACCKIHAKTDFNVFSFFPSYVFGFFDRKILNVLGRRSGPVTLAELIRGSGFARDINQD
jgi:hypothetical protein